MTREGIIDVPGASLRYRLAGTPGGLPPIVLENGWGSSHDYFALFRDALAAQAQVLLYSRAGVGGSVAHAPTSAEGMSRNLVALLDALGFREPVVVAGQSYGGLICGVHAALMPERLRAIVQIDPTPECPEPVVDSSLKGVVTIAGLLKWMARLRIPEPLFTSRMTELSPADRDNIRRFSFGSVASLDAAVRELDLLQEIRAVCARPSPTPRLVISAGTSDEVPWLLSKVVSQNRSRSLLAVAQAQHQATAARGGDGSRWIELPHSHGGLVVTRAGAAETAARTIDFLRGLPVAG